MDEFFTGRADPSEKRELHGTKEVSKASKLCANQLLKREKNAQRLADTIRMMMKGD